jgi:hypothetical protein
MCTAEDHDRLRADPIEFRQRTVLMGMQLAENGNPELELRNCCECGSTLALEHTVPVEHGGPGTPR